MDDDFDDDGFAIVAPPRLGARSKSKKSKAAAVHAPVGAFASFAAAASAPASMSDSSEDDRPLSTLKSSGKKTTSKSKARAKPKSSKTANAAPAPPVSTAASTKKKAKRKAKPAAAAATPSPPLSPSSQQEARRPSGGMLSVFELCNTDDENRAGGPHSVGARATSGGAGGDTEEDNESDDNTSTLGSEPDAARRSADDDETNSTVDGDNGSDQDEGWSDHNRWYCNICKDGGELLCCDRCPRAFHMSCLGMGETAIPDTEWFCKMCSECLDRRRAKLEKKEKARLLREAEKLERDAKRLQLQQMKEELIAKRSVDAIENKAKRVLEMQDRILSRKKIKYKDKEEEKLGKLAEDLAQTVRDAKEKLEKLEKEDAALKKKEETLNKRKKGPDDLPDDSDSAVRSEKPIPQECSFGELPPQYTGSLLAVWDSIASFSTVLQLSPVSVEQFARALTHTASHTTLLTQVHMCLLELILEDREDDDYVSDDDSAMDERERYRYEVQRAPLTIGVPTLSMLTSLAWPCVLHSLVLAVPRFTAHAPPELLAAVDALRTTEYPELEVAHKLALLHFLVRRALNTEKIRQVLAQHLDASIQASKAFSRAVLLDRKVALEDEKKLREKQRAELAGLLEKTKTTASVKTWLKNDKKGASDSTGTGAGNGTGGAGDDDAHHHHLNDNDAQSESGAPGSTASDSELDDLASSEDALAKSEEELEQLQRDECISRHEYLARKKRLETQRERLRKRAEEKLRKQRQQEQLERKRTSAKKAIQEALMAKDAAMLDAAIEKGKECALPERIIVSATHVLEILEAEAAREDDASSRKRNFNDLIRASFVRTEPLGRDRHQNRYWMLQGDPQRLYVEKPQSLETLKLKYDAASPSAGARAAAATSAEWYCYSSEAEVVALMDALDVRIPREAQLKTALMENFDVITAEMPLSKPGLLISDLLNEDSASGRKRQRKGAAGSNANGNGNGNAASSATPSIDFLAWCNERKTWRRAPHARVDVAAFCADLVGVETWLSKRLRDVGSDWSDRSPGGHADWLKNVSTAASVQDCIAPLLALEAEVMAFELKSQGLTPLPQSQSQSQVNGSAQDPASKSASSATGDSARGENDKSDDEDDEDDDLDALADDGSILWPSALCRTRWIDAVTRARTIATLAVALASLEQRLDVFGLAEAPSEEASGVSTRRAKSEKEKRSRKERAARKKQSSEDDVDADGADADDGDELAVRDSNDDWDEDCYICSEGGELLCCDGCPRVFHYTCAGLRRVPRGKTFCHVCDPSVKPVYPVPKSSSATTRKDVTAAAQTTGGGGASSSSASDARASAAAASSGGAGDHIHTASGGHPQTTTKSSEDQWDVDCSVCALGGELLCCDGCPRAFHVTCIGMDSVPDDEWFCDECNLQTCAACKKNKIRLDSHVICGSEDGTQGCEGVFHLKCARLSAVPEDDWFCKKCRATLVK